MQETIPGGALIAEKCSNHWILDSKSLGKRKPAQTIGEY